MKKALLAFTAGILQKIGIAGMALGIFQYRFDATSLGALFLASAYGFKLWKQKL